MRQYLAPLSCATVLALVFGASAAAAASHNISTVAGTGTAGYSGDGGPASQADLGTPVAVSPMPDGGYLIFQQGAGVVRRVQPDGTITTVAGNGTAGYTGDGGQATAASLSIPSGGTLTPDGGYLIADTNNNVIRKVAPDGTISTAVGNGSATFGGDDGPAVNAQVNFPYDVVVQPDGGYLIADVDNNRIRRVSPGGVITTVAGGGGSLGDGGPATAAQLFKPSGVALTPDGGFLIADTYNHRVRKVAFDGTITTVAGTGTAGATGDDGPATQATLNRPTRVAVEPDGGFIICDELNNRIRRVAPDGTITTVTGSTSGFSGDGGPAAAGQLNNPIGLAVTASGDYLIADTGNQRIRQVDVDPPAPVLIGSNPASPADDNTPEITGTAAPDTTVSLFTDAACSGTPVASGPAASLAATGITVDVLDNSTTTFHATVTDSTGNSSACSTSAVTYVEESESAALPPPVRGRTVNAIPEKGKVLVKLPKGNRQLKGTTAGRFVPLESIGRQIPVGSTLDTTKGTVLLTSARNTTGATQDGHFNGGVFTLTQTRKNPLTTVSMTGSKLNSCSRLPRGGARKVAAAAKRKRRTLFSNVKGRFRTRGRNSTATVRGTSWRVTDTCKGTLTTVKTGSVKVRDFNLRKTKTVKAGHSYFARSPAKKKKRL